MLHEILLSLSGQPSPLFDDQKGETAIPEDNSSLLAPPEKALLASVAHLSRLHAQLRKYASEISSTNRSMVCRSVSTAIIGTHLGEFQKKILEVERAILAEDSGYVGGYGIVPLSTIVGEFAPWTRRMEWLWSIIRFIKTERKTTKCSHGATGAALIDHLRTEAQTGYLDIKDMALQLTTAAETAWMKQLSMWLLYGNIPMYGKDDFFIQEESQGEDEEVHFSINTHLLPRFVTTQTAGSILFIGKSLNHIRAKRKTSIAGTSTAPVMLYREHIEQLEGIKSPISPSKLTSAVDCIRLSLSQSTLSKLLPLPKILEILTLLHDFLLLGRGEFAVALIAHADSRIEESRRRSLPATRSSGKLDGLTIKEGDVTAALTQAWAELFSLQKEEDPADEELELARDLLCLSISTPRNGRPTTPAQAPNSLLDISRVSFEDLLFPTPTHLSAQIRAPLDLFISSSDIVIYSRIHSYLLAIRRAQIRLGDLWKRTPLRRNYPTPWGPPRSNSKFGQAQLKARRDRDNTRLRQMRPVWATSSACLFMLSEIGGFFQGDVVNESWQHLREWIQGRSSPTASTPASRPGTASSAHPYGASKNVSLDRMPDRDLSGSQTRQQTMGRHDPEALTVAHRRHLSSLVQSLLLTEPPFTNTLKTLLTNIDRFVALVIRLETIQRNMDLETDEGVEDALVDYAQEEREVWDELRSTRTDVETGLKKLVDSLRDIDDRRSGEGRGPVDLSANFGQMGPGSRRDEDLSPGFSHYVPHKAAGVDRLLMKLDFGSLRSGFGPEATAGFAGMQY